MTDAQIPLGLVPKDKQSMERFHEGEPKGVL
jgi:hypothetical protein